MLTILAYMIIAMGLVLFPLPVPVGIFFIIGGVALLISVDAGAQKHIAKLRKKHSKIDNIMQTATERPPRYLRVILQKTKPPSQKSPKRNSSNRSEPSRE